MITSRKRRLYFILIVLVGISAAVAFALFALRKNINLYYTPSELFQQKLQSAVRLGGFVVQGSVHHQKNTLKVTFVLTDFHQKVPVEYVGVLPSLFREGQGIVAAGHLNTKGVFVANQVLAKHGAQYHPPNINRVYR